MGYNQDRPYEHFTGSKFSGKNIPETSTRESEASECPDPVNFKEISGLQKPWEAKDDFLREQFGFKEADEEKGEKSKDR